MKLQCSSGLNKVVEIFTSCRITTEVSGHREDKEMKQYPVKRRNITLTTVTRSVVQKRVKRKYTWKKRSHD